MFIGREYSPSELGREKGTTNSHESLNRGEDTECTKRSAGAVRRRAGTLVRSYIRCAGDSAAGRRVQHRDSSKRPTNRWPQTQKGC